MRMLSTLLLSLVGLGTGLAQGQSATASNVPATARIYVPITVTLTNSGLSFGDIYANVTGGNVVLDPSTDLRTPTGGLVLGTLSQHNSAALRVGGKRNATFVITLPANGTVTLTGPGTAMAVNAFTAAVGTTTLTAPFASKLPDAASANLTFKVGGTLVVGANQMDGDYTGTFAVTVAYN
ncbi:MAG: DUF4402 domain-containing protein [Geothrix sp.]|uniref:DUF4402 domain-containing protein n=1 Tax=Geothrix sp. TaxID=1962974 RepID=UPI003BAFADD3